MTNSCCGGSRLIFACPFPFLLIKLITSSLRIPRVVRGYAFGVLSKQRLSWTVLTRCTFIYQESDTYDKWMCYRRRCSVHSASKGAILMTKTVRYLYDDWIESSITPVSRSSVEKSTVCSRGKQCLQTAFSLVLPFDCMCVDLFFSKGHGVFNHDLCYTTYEEKK
jgi:hypothetical protein